MHFDESSELARLGEKQTSSEDIFDGVILHVKRDQVELSNGSVTVREVIRHIGAVCVVPVTDDSRELRAPFELTIGRAPSASPGTWHVADKWLSKAHFRVSAGADGIPVVEDLDSLNGTSVNDRPLTGRRILRRGDAIAAGHSVFVFF